jgi:hypothetical protein
MWVTRRTMLVLGIFLGLLLLMIGNIGSGHRNVTLAGDFIFAITLICGGLLSEENQGIKIALMAIGGLFVISAFTGSSLSLSSLLGR